MGIFLCLSTVMPCTLQIKTGSLRAKEPCKSSKRPGYLGIYPCGGGAHVYMCVCVCADQSYAWFLSHCPICSLKLGLSVTCNLLRKQGPPTTESLSP